MPTNEKLIPQILSEEERYTLNFILNQMIPASEDGRLPSATEVGFLSYSQTKGTISWVREGIVKVNKESLERYKGSFADLNPSEQVELIELLRRKMFQYFGRLVHQVIECYYQDDKVLAAIGAAVRPPFPEGFHVPDGDLTLLESVYLREKIYRE